MREFISLFKSFIKKNKLAPIIDVIYFAILLLGFHYIWKYWESELEFRFFTDKSIFIPVFEFLTNIVFNTSDIFLSFLVKDHYYIEKLTWHFDNGGYIAIVDGCSGLKASIQFIVIILLFPGPWKHKAWFIPTGLIVLFIANIIRIVGLSLIVYYHNSWYSFTHDFVFRPFFYGVIFLMWIVWVEKFKNRRIRKIQ
jgi:exosortase family protein XrtF